MPGSLSLLILAELLVCESDMNGAGGFLTMGMGYRLCHKHRLNRGQRTNLQPRNIAVALGQSNFALSR